MTQEFRKPAADAPRVSWKQNVGLPAITLNDAFAMSGAAIDFAADQERE